MEWAETQLQRFIEADYVWAIEVAMRLEQKRQGSVSGLGLLEGDDE